MTNAPNPPTQIEPQAAVAVIGVIGDAGRGNSVEGEPPPPAPHGEASPPPLRTEVDWSDPVRESSGDRSSRS